MQIGGEVFVNKGAGGGEKALDLPAAVTVDDAVMADAKPVEAFKLIAERLGVTCGESEDGGLHGPPGLGGEGALVVAHLICHIDFSWQGWTRGRT